MNIEFGLTNISKDINVKYQKNDSDKGCMVSIDSPFTLNWINVLTRKAAMVVLPVPPDQNCLSQSISEKFTGSRNKLRDNERKFHRTTPNNTRDNDVTKLPTT